MEKTRHPYRKAFDIAQEIVAKMQAEFPKAKVSIAGSLRRQRDPRDIDILLAGSGDAERYSDFFRTLGDTAIDLGTKSTAIMIQGIQADLRIVPLKSFGAGLLFFTGSMEFNIRTRIKAKTMGLKLNRYELKDRFTEKNIAGKTEKSIFKALGLEWREPATRQ